MKNSVKILLITLLFFLIFPQLVSAQDNCPNRFVTLINPVRGRNLWLDKSTSPIREQSTLIKSFNFPATWLVQYDVLTDTDLLGEIKRFDDKQELGVFLEVTPALAQDSRVIYPHAVAWDDPNAVFLSGYSRTDRRKLIDTLFRKFNEEFGNYPKSVGAWWIDSYSVDYLHRKYGIASALIVADQKTTDDYGVWGQWWGVSYYPDSNNILAPATNQTNQTDVLILQWAQRDLTKAYGEGPRYSNYSLQANDYTSLGLTTSYFVELTEKYLDCSLTVGQITVGLETGMESVKSFPEYQKQLSALSKLKGIQAVTMSTFADLYHYLNSSNPTEVKLSDNISTWQLTSDSRKNNYLHEEIVYDQQIAFADYFVSDNSKFLDRRLPLTSREVTTENWLLYLLPLAAGLVLYWRGRILSKLLPVILFAFSAFALVLRAYRQFGWNVYFGPVFANLTGVKISVVSVSLLIIYFLIKFLTSRRIKHLNLLVWFLPLSFFIDAILYFLRYSFFNNRHYLGFAADSLRFIGVSFSKSGLTFVNQDFPGVVAGSFLRFPYADIWKNPVLTFAVYPLVHILIAYGLWMVLKDKQLKVRRWVIFSAVFLYLLFIGKILTLDPVSVEALK